MTAETESCASINTAMAKKMINASICAYQIHEKSWTPGKGEKPVIRKEEGPNDAYFYNVTPFYQNEVCFIKNADKYTPLFTASGKDEINAALVGAMDDGNLVLAIRGTIPPSFTNNDIVAWISDWCQDAEMEPVDWPMDCNGQKLSPKAEKGFAKAMNNLWPDIKKMIEDTVKAHKCTGVVITGHSKGAAMTFLAATLIQQHFPQFKNNISVYAFAAPVVGNSDFQTAYQSMNLDTNTHRFQVENDVVPFLPLWSSANVFKAVKFPNILERGAWDVLASWVKSETANGYSAVGDFSFYSCSHQLVPNATADGMPLTEVAKAISALDITKVGDAHSAVKSYLPCFQ